MTTRDRSRFVLVSQALGRRPGLFFSLWVVALAAAGCGSSSTDPQPFPEFEGVWAIDDDTSSLSCPMEVGLDSVPFSIWNTSVTMDAGVLGDLIEAQDICRFSYDVMGKIATLANPDPYTGMAPTCKVSVSSTDDSNVVLAPTASPVWTFKLLAPVQGKAPTAQIVGAAGATVSLADSNGNLQTLTPCTFAAQLNLHKIAKP